LSVAVLALAQAHEKRITELESDNTAQQERIDVLARRVAALEVYAPKG
jgi:uncharacterized coiled-coil protein SlyX